MEKFEIKEHQILRELPRDKNCFVCGVKATEGLGMRIFESEDGYAVGLCRTREIHQGFPGVTHGGLVSACLDEVLWFSTRLDDPEAPAMTLELNVKFLSPVPAGQDLRVAAKLIRTEGRHLYSEGYILLEDDTVAARAEAHLLTLKPEQAAAAHGIYSFTDGPLPESVRF